MHFAKGLRLFPVLAIVSITACNEAGSNETFTLYRSSVVIQNARMHVATFDTADGREMNLGNCNQARDLFQAQPGVQTKFWCEKGRFSK